MQYYMNKDTVGGFHMRKCSRCRLVCKTRCFDGRWFNRCCCNMKRSFDEIYKMFNPK